MKAKHNNRLNNTQERNGRALVIGGSVAGLSTARVLAQHFEQVTVLERDRLPEKPAFRAGIPQAHHAHTLLPYGQKLLDRLFPGLLDQLLAEGALATHPETETVYYEQGIWHKPEPRTSRPSVSCSRPLLENLLYRRMAEIPQVKIWQGVEATGLTVDDRHRNVTGVTVRRRPEVAQSAPKDYAVQNFPADLVVDASGRNSKVPRWLASLGFTPPEEWQINAHAGYASRIYQRPTGFPESWKKLYVGPSPPDGLRGGVIVPLEDDRWHVTLIGMAGDYPPTDENGFMAFARSLPTQALSEAIREAKPLSMISGYRKNENRMRRFDHLPHYLEGLLVLGDAAYAMNPVYSLGMTAAAVGCQVLDQILRARKTHQSQDGLAAAFQKKLAARIAALWQQAVRGDWVWPATEISDNTEELVPQFA